MPNVLAQAFVYLAAAVIVVPVAKRLGLGSVLGYLLAGVALGPFALRLIGSEGEDVMHFAEFGVVMMLFLVGLELKPSLLWQLRKPIFGLGGAQVVLTAVVVGGLGTLLGVDWRISTGGPQFAYRKDGYNRFTIRELLAPFDQTAHLCGMKFLAPFVLHSSLKVESDDALAPHGSAYRRMLEALRDDTLDVERAMKAEKLSDELDVLIRRAS